VRQPCPGCGKARILLSDSGMCVVCSRRCRSCNARVRRPDRALCKTCRRKAAAAAAKSSCPRCGRPGIIRKATGWCGTCSRPKAGRKPPRACGQCSAATTHPINGLCSACWQRHPDRPRIRAQHLIDRLEVVPPWLAGFIEDVIDVYSPARAVQLIARLEPLLRGEQAQRPHDVLERARTPGRSIGPLARALQDYFVRHHLAIATDHDDLLARGRRQRRIDATPEPLRPATAAFAASLLTANDRARRARTKPRSDSTIQHALATVRDLAIFLNDAGKTQWSLVDRGDVEAFLAAVGPGLRPRTLTVLRQFFRWARTSRQVLVDPTTGLRIRQRRGFTGRTIPVDRQRALYRRWTTDTSTHPHEALVGLLALLHGVSSHEARTLTVHDIDTSTRAVSLGTRPYPTPLDPASWDALQRAVLHRDSLRTANPHVLVTRGTKPDSRAASSAYLAHILDPVGLSPRALRVTRLADLVNTMDPKLVACAYGLNPEGVLDYLADHVDTPRLHELEPNP